MGPVFPLPASCLPAIPGPVGQGQVKIQKSRISLGTGGPQLFWGEIQVASLFSFPLFPQHFST